MAYYLLLDESIRTEDEQKARERVISRLRAVEYEAETGMPAITQWMLPANEM